MHKRYFRKKNPHCPKKDTEWIEMTGAEFYRFVNSPEAEGRFFIDMGDVVLEGTEAEAVEYKAEKDHHRYLRKQEEDWITLPFRAFELRDGHIGNGEEVIGDEAQDVEAEAMLHIDIQAVKAALSLLDADSFQLIHALFLTKEPQTLRQLSQESGVPVSTLQDRKKKLLALLKKWLR